MDFVSALFRKEPKECHTKENAFIILGDSVEVLKIIKDNSVDLIIADPPYNIGKKLLSSKMNKDEYVEWSKRWIDECMRILKPTGTFYYMTATQFMPYIDSYIDTAYCVKQRICWVYDSSGVQARTFFGSMYEPILMILKNEKQYIFNSEEVMVEAKTGSKRKLIDYRKTPPQPYNTKKVRGNVWDIPRVRYLMDEYENHPTQKPAKLLEIMIKASSNKGDVVLDPFGGSFSTSVVAQNLGRKSVSIEVNKEYYKIGLRRLNILKVYKGERLVKIKKRKTNNKSKADHELNKETKNQ